MVDIANIQKQQQCEDIVTQSIRAYGHIDIFMNNAGASIRSECIQTKLEVDKQLMDINYFAPIALTKTLLPHFIQQKKGNWLQTQYAVEVLW